MNKETLQDWEKRKIADDEILRQTLERLMADGNDFSASTETGKNRLLSALKFAAVQMGLDAESVKEPELEGEEGGTSVAAGLSYVLGVCEKSRIGARKVTLKGEWHTFDSGIIMAFKKADGQPVVLVPQAKGQYIAHEPESKKYYPVTAQAAGDFVPTALTFYKLFPATQLSIGDIIRFSRGYYKLSNGIPFLGALLVSALLSMVTPAVSAKIFGEVVPSSDAQLLVIIAVTLFLLAIGSALVNLVKGLALTNMESSVDMAMHAAVIERLFSMPDAFYKKYTSGELLARLNDIHSIRKTLATTGIGVMSALLTMLFNGILLFYYGGMLAWIVLASSLLYGIVIVFIAWRQMLYYQQHIVLGSDLSSKLLQIINNIAKIKIMRAEKRAFRLWAEVLAKQLHLDIKEMNLGIVSSIMLMLIQVVTTLILYYFIVASIGQKDAMPLSQFIAFNAAYGVFSGSFSSIVGSLSGLMHIIPVYKRITPLLETLPEGADVGGKTIVCQGAIKVENVTFSYGKGTGEERKILDDVSLTIEPGEFVAIVGSSGSGKTTLMKVLLGFLQPDKGAVYFDEQEVSTLDIKCIRRQCGTVLQTGQLLPGTIFQNIVGVYDYTMEDAWQAAALAELDQDIARMPMQMFTMVTEGAATLSGGQRQRLLIARALVKKPRILLFDEATSALDNLSQAKVMQSIERLAATKIVIAHRISTIRNADKIIVLDQGRVAEMGSYEELVRQGGHFANFAKKQELA